MFKSTAAASRQGILLSLGVIGVIAAILAMPYGTEVSAVRKQGDGTATKKAQDEGLPNYDIRRDKQAFEKMAAFRNTANRSASEIADDREDLVRAETALRSKLPAVKFEYSPELGMPEVISPDVMMGRSVLARATQQKKSGALRSFLRENKGVIGATDAQVDGLKLFADYKNPDGNLAFVEYTQEVNEIPVFRGAIRAAYSKEGELIRIVNNFAPGLDYSGLSTEFGDPSAALSAAARHLNYELPPADMARSAENSTANKVKFGEGEWSPIVEKLYFPTEPGVAVPAWRVIIWQPLHAYMVIVHAETGEMLWRKRITEEQAQGIQFEVYTNPQAMVNIAKSPAPAAPTVFDPNLGTQGLPIFRSNVLKVGNEAPFAFNNKGWIADGFNITDGNNVESGLDLTSPNGIDADSQAQGSPYRVFSSTWNPPPGIPDPGDAPGTEAARRGAVIQQFYVMNVFHDEMYRLGFTEAARNFQAENFGRGGVTGNDRISAEAQDFAGENNANFGTSPDGIRGRMQMFVFTAPHPDRDGALDAEMMIHEATHGVSNRLIANADGLWSNMGRAMGEGWSDFYAHSMLSEPNDPVNGTYSLSGYLLLNAFGAVGNKNYYYGIRRFPKAIITSTGGPNNRPHNPLTFADIDQIKMNISDGAFPAMFGAHVSTTADQVHAAGEIWSTALWEVRGRLVQRLGWEAGNRRALQLVTDAMKVTPINPSFIQGRDAILSVALGSGTTSSQLQDVADVWAGFAARGMGVNASVTLQGTGLGDARVVESFDKPNLLQMPAFTFTDTGGDSDGIAEPSEPIVISVPLTNLVGAPAATVTADIPGAGSAIYGTIPNAASVTRQFNYTLPANTVCGSLVQLTMNVNSSLGQKTFALAIPVGTKAVTLQENFDLTSLPNLPSGWTTTTTGANSPWVTTTSASISAPFAAFAAGAGATGSAELVSPSFQVNSASATVEFRNRFTFETAFDGGRLEISVNNGGFVDILEAGGSFLTNGYNGTVSTNAESPLAGRQVWTGSSGNLFAPENGFATTTVQLPASANGQSVRLRWRLGSDSSVASTGWHIDNVVIRATGNCSFSGGGGSGIRSRADFDGDGKSDPSIFRPSEGNWYVAKSNGGINVITWGVSTDQLAPGDFDGDGKADLSIFRPTAGTTPDFFIVHSGNFVIKHVSWGDPGDKPVVGDYDGDGKDDVAVFRPSNNTWYIVKSTGGLQSDVFGQAGDVAVPGKFDADNKTDRAVYRNGQWIVTNSTGGTMIANWGEPGDILVPADYDGDNRDDVAIWRPSTGFWYIRRSTNFALDIFSWGEPGDIPAPGDFDGDGRDDPTVFRPSNGVWYQVRSSQGLARSNWGVPGDIPIPRRYVP